MSSGGKKVKSNVQLLVLMQSPKSNLSAASNISSASKTDGSDKSDEIKIFPSDEIFIHHLLGGKYRFGDIDVNPDNFESFAALKEMTPTLPHWADREMIKRGQKFAQRNFFGLSYAHLLSLIILLGLPENRRFLRYTGNSHTPHKAYKRYLATLLEVKFWYECTDEKVWLESIHRIRKMHAQKGMDVEMEFPDFTQPIIKDEETAKTLKIGDELKPGDNSGDGLEEDKPKDKFYKDEKIWKCVLKDLVFNEENLDLHEVKIPSGGHHYSQFDMAMTQWSFMALPVLEPKAFWIHDHDDGEMKDFIHLWAVIGDVLGLEDQYNLCTATELEHCKVICNKILVEIFIPSLLKVDYETEIMWKALVLGMTKFVHKDLKLISLLIDIFEKIIKVECPSLRYQHAWSEWFSEIIDNFIFRPLLHTGCFRSFATKRLCAWVNKAAKKNKMSRDWEEMSKAKKEEEKNKAKEK